MYSSCRTSPAMPRTVHAAALVLAMVAFELSAVQCFQPSLVPVPSASMTGRTAVYVSPAGRIGPSLRGARTPLALRMQERQDDIQTEETRKTAKARSIAAANDALQLLLSRRSALGLTAAASAAALIPKKPAEAESVSAIEDAFGEGVRKAPGKLIVGKDGSVEKSPEDKRSYRTLTLPNGLRVLLASDPATNKASAALDVHVGHFSDPDAIAGMAHFCEHMLFLGTTKYPEEGYLEKFLSVHGGSSNAFTSNEDTNYHFSVNQDSLEPALDIFSQFFISPLFTAAATGRELNAIESEHSKNLQTDSWRSNQVLKLRGNQKHPYAKFGTGNKYTLEQNTKEMKIDLREELLAFHDKYYSANIMTLCVLGREDLDTLQQMVVSKFSAVRNTDRPTPEVEWQGKVAAFPPEAPETIYKLKPVKEARDIRMEWALPFKDAADRATRWATKPTTLVSSCIGHEGKGSLLSYLKYEKGWVNSLGCSIVEDTADMEVWGLRAGLTKEGEKHRDEVVEAIFAYIQMLKETGLPSYIGQEMVELNSLFWKFRESPRPQEFATDAAINMQSIVDPTKYISDPVRFASFSLEKSTEILNKFTPESCLITYTSPDTPGERREKWYGAMYSTEPVGERIERWRKPAKVAAFKVPEPNPFVPSDFSLKGEITEKPNDPITPPEVILDDERWKVYWKGDNRYGKPTAYAIFRFNLPNTFFGEGLNPRTSALCKLFRKSLGDALNEYSYPALEAGLIYDLSFTVKGPELTFNGYNDKLPDFLKTVARTIAGHVPSDQQKFERYKESVAIESKGFINDQPYRHASLFARTYQISPSYTPLEVLDELQSISLGDLQKFAKSVWKKAYVESLIQGNVEKSTALSMVRAVNDEIPFAELPQKERAQTKLVKVPVVQSGYGSLLNREEPNPANPNSAVILRCQSSDRDIKHQVAWEVLAAMMEQPFYNSLRTQQQLGYIVSSGTALDEGLRSLQFTVQSSVADTSYLTSAMLEFVEGFRETVEGVSDAEFGVFVEGLVRQRLEREKKLSNEVASHWSEIQGDTTVFDRLQREAAALRTLAKGDVLRVYQDCVAQGGTNRRVFTSEIRSAVPDKHRAKGPLLAYPGLRIVPEKPKEFQAENGYYDVPSAEQSKILSYKPII
uniref:Peptidase M16 N-terminal domain-containing protein n=1 Tax=Hemiselmis andersenii TaxID=464988 RepID=A0A6T8KCF8_HEMAN